MPPKPNSHSNGRHFDFTEPRVNWDIPNELLDPPFSYHWEQYPSFISRLIYDAGVPPPASAGAGPSTRSTSTALPRLLVPIEQVVAALAAAYSAGQKSNQYKFQEIDYKLEELYDSFRFARNTREELQALKKSCEEGDQCHENLANGVVALSERVTALETGAETATTERNEAHQDRVAISAQLEQAVQGIQALNLAMEQMAEEIQANGGGQDQEEEEVAGDFIEIDDLEGNPIEPEEADEEPEVIDP